VGDALTYTINWANGATDESGAATAADVTVTDTIPTGTTYVSGSASDGGTYDEETGTITWTLGTQAAGTRGRVTFKVTVDEEAFKNSSNKITNTATRTAGENTSTTNTVTNYVPEKSVQHSNGSDADGDTVTVGEILTYTITFRNTDSADATAVVTDELASVLTYKEGSYKVEGAEVESFTVEGEEELEDGTSGVAQQTLTWNLTDIAAGTTVTVRFKATVAEVDTATSFSNTATVNDLSSNTVENNIPVKSVYNAGGANVDGEMVSVGETLTYEITFINTKGAEAEATVTDTLPAAMTYAGTYEVTGGVVADEDDYKGFVEDGQNLTWYLYQIADGATVTIRFTAIVGEAAAADEIANTAKVGNASTTTVTNYVPQKQVLDSTGADVAGEELTAGEDVTYVITFVNRDGDDATATVTDTLPALFAYNGSYEVTGADIESYEMDGRTLTWQLSGIKDGATVKVTINGFVAGSSAGGTLENTASVNGSATNTTANSVPGTGYNPPVTPGGGTTTVESEPETGVQGETESFETESEEEIPLESESESGVQGETEEFTEEEDIPLDPDEPQRDGGKNGTKPVKTGDTSPIIPLAGALGVSALAILIMLRRRRGKDDEGEA